MKIKIVLFIILSNLANFVLNVSLSRFCFNILFFVFPRSAYMCAYVYINKIQIYVLISLHKNQVFT